MNFLQKQLEDIFISLSEKEKNIFTLRFEQKLSIKEIAIILNMPEGSIKSGIFYLLKKYSHILNHYLYEK
jgi:DNA-directed RNA polymerase specialized sigma24 family protein